MNHPILDSIVSVKRRARRLALTRAAASVVVCAVLAGIVIACCDYLLRLEDPGTRWLFTVAWIGAVVVAVWYFFVPIWKTQWSNQSIAFMIERRFPSLANRLSSSIAFLQAGDSSSESVLGSKTLMRNVINQTSTDVAEIKLSDAVDSRPTWKWIVFAVGTLCLCGAAFLMSASTASKALTRLLLPFRAEPWPRVNNLAFVDAPKKVARGSDLRLALIDGENNLPQHVDLQVWYDGESKRELDTIPMRQETVTDDAGARSTQMTFERTNVSRSFHYRAVGGDDQTMGWQPLEVVDAPRVIAGEVKLLPPKYTGWFPKKLSEPTGGLRVLQGTEAVLSGTSDRSLKQVELLVSRGNAEGDETKFLGKFDGQGKAFEVPSPVAAQRWLIEKTSEYSLSLTDVDNTSTVDADRWTVRVVRDERPTLKLLEPDNEELITPTASVPIHCEVEDDLAIRDVQLRYLRTDKSDAGQETVELFAGPEMLVATAMPQTMPPPRDQQQVRHAWSLKPLKLAPGAVLSFHLVASDYKDQVSQTLARRLVVVTENDLIDRVGRRQSLVLSRLEQRLNQQRQAKEGVDASLANVQETNKASKSTMDRLQSSLMTQRQVNSALVGDEAEVTKELRRLRAMLDRSQIGKVDVRTRVEKTLAELKALGETDLDPAIRQATSARQTLQAERDQQSKSDKRDDALSPEVAQEVMDQLTNASKRQESAVAKLESLLDDLSAWDNYRRFGQELSDLLRQQRDIQRQTQEVAKESLSRSGQELDGSARAAQRGAAARQLDLARRTDRTLENLAKAEQELQEKDPNAAQLVNEAIERARDEAVSGKMREAGRQIDENRLGLASQQQQDAASTLEDMLDELSQRSYSPEQRVEKMDKTSRELERLQKRQSQLTQEFAKSERETDSAKKARELERLKKRQEQVAKEVRKMERQLERLRSQQSSQQAGQAAGSAEIAADAAEQGDAEEARKQSELAEAQMEQAQQSLQQQKEEAKTELAQEQAIRLPQLIEALIAQQQSVVDEVKRLNDIREERGNLSKAQEASIGVTAEAQRTVAQDTALVSKQMKELPVFVFALNEVEQLMLEVAGSLERLETSDATQELSRRVLDELTLIVEMLKRDPNSQQQAGGGGQGGSGQEGGGADGGQGDGIDPRLAQLKLLRGMQVSLNEETKRLNTMSAGDMQARQIIERQQHSLASRQGQLGEIIGEMFKPAPKRLDAPSLEETESVEGQNPDNGLDALDQELELLLQ